MKNYIQISHEFVTWKHKINNINRYYTNAPLIDLLWDNKDLLEYNVLRGESFFRGRIFDLDDVVSTNNEYINWVDSREEIFQGYDKKLRVLRQEKARLRGT